MSAENMTPDAPGFDDLNFTPAASEALDLTADLFKRQVVQEISRTHRRSGSRVRVSDVEVAADQVAAERPVSIRIVPLLTRLALFLAAGTLIAQAAILLSGGSKSWIVSGAALLAGISTGTTVVILVQEARRRRRRSIAASRGFLSEVAALESDARRAVVIALGRGAETASLGRIISALEILKIWTPEDSQIFRNVLSLRNSLVHEESPYLSPEDIRFGLAQVVRLADLIRRGEKSLEYSADKENSSVPFRRRSLDFNIRVAHALQKASFEVMSAVGDHGYDLLVETPRGSLAILTKYRDRGELDVADLLQASRMEISSLPVVVVTNLPLSPSVAMYLESHGTSANLAVVSWPTGEPDARLAENVMQAVDDFSAPQRD